MKIRSATPEDAEVLACLAGQLGYPLSRPGEMASRLVRTLADPEQAVLVAALPRAGVIGWIHVCTSPRLIAQPRAELGGLIVDEDHRGAGAGRALLVAAENWARARGYDQLRIRSNAIRKDAHRFYERMGYHRAKSQHVYDKAL